MGLVLAVAAGGALGSLARYGLGAWIGSPSGGFPFAILAVNVLGSFAMGVVAGIGGSKAGLSPEVQTFLAVGVLGGFTTFSAFSLDAATLIQRGDWGLAALYVCGSVILSVGALFAGLALVRAAA